MWHAACQVVASHLTKLLQTMKTILSIKTGPQTVLYPLVSLILAGGYARSAPITQYDSFSSLPNTGLPLDIASDGSMGGTQTLDLTRLVAPSHLASGTSLWSVASRYAAQVTGADPGYNFSYPGDNAEKNARMASWRHGLTRESYDYMLTPAPEQLRRVPEVRAWVLTPVGLALLTVLRRQR